MDESGQRAGDSADSGLIVGDRMPDAVGGRLRRGLWLALGLFCVALAVIGALLPLMPTTIFLILAAGCFARSSPRLERWLLDHRHFGPTLRAWRAEGAIPRRGKIAACLGMALGYALFWWSARPAWSVAGIALVAVVTIAIGASAAYVLTRPTARASV